MMEPVQVRLKRKYTQRKTMGLHKGGERYAPKRHYRKNAKHDQSKQRYLTMVLVWPSGRKAWREI